MPAALPASTWVDLAGQQAGAISRRQLRALGVTRREVSHTVVALRSVRDHRRARRWQRPHPGTYVVFTGPMPPLTRVWAAILYAGEAAVACHETAAWLDGLRSDLPDEVDVCVPHGRRHRGSRPGVRVHQSRHLGARQHPARLPPRLRLEHTVLDLTDRTRDPERVVDLVLRACQRRLTTAQRLRAAAAGRKRLRWRALVRELVADVVDGVQSTLERRYRHDVERPHGLPRGRRNRADGDRGQRRYRDVRYARWKVVVELDGRAAHPEEWRERDDMRDNELADRQGARTLRYGWSSVAARPCETAAQVGRVLVAAGWPGAVIACGPGCTAASAGSDAS